MYRARVSTPLRRHQNGDTREGPSRAAWTSIEIAFDDERLVADAGLVLPATLCERLGAQGVIDGLVGRPGEPARAGAGAKALSVALAMLAGADSIDDIDRLRAGRERRGARRLPARRPPPPASGCAASASARCASSTPPPASCLRRAWGAGARPERLVIDLDSSIAEVHGRKPRPGRALRPHPGARLPPDPRHLGRDGRRDPRPPAPRRGQHPVRGGALLRGVDRPLPAGRPPGRVPRARRLGVPQLPPVAGDPPPRRPLLGVGHDAGPRASGDRADRRGRLARRSPTRARGGPRSPRRRSPWTPSTAAAPIPCPSAFASWCDGCSTTTPHHPQQPLFQRLPLLPDPHQPRPTTSPWSRPSTATTPRSSW